MPTKKSARLPMKRAVKTPIKRDEPTTKLDVVRQVLHVLIGMFAIAFAVISIAMPSVPAGVLAVCFVRAFVKVYKDGPRAQDPPSADLSQ